jgi:hypothetical protein
MHEQLIDRDLRDVIIDCAKAYSLFIMFYLFVALSIQAIKESANNPNHWA